MSTQAIDLDKLNVEERLDLIEGLWNSLTDDPSRVPLTEAQKKELDRRLDKIEAGDAAGIPWDEVLKQVQSRLS